MKKILIVSHALEIGGAERSLIGLLDAIDKKEYQVDLFLLRHEGELFSFIPEDIHLLPEIPSYTVLARPMVQILKEGHVELTAARMYGKIKASRYIKKHGHTDSGVPLEYSHKYTYRFMPDIQPNEEYDLAISFLTPHYIVAHKVHAKKKIAWIHTDYSKIQINEKSELEMWSAYDRIISISDDVTKTFLKIFPTLSAKIVKIENIIPEKLIVHQSKEFVPIEEMSDDSIKILSIGRYCTAKNFDNVPKICKYLVSRGMNVKWYLIGFGSDEKLIKEKIKKEHMEKNVIMLGKKSNPYPYICRCDLYVQPSRYEGKCVSVKEAQMLGKPVVITNYATAKSQLEDGVDGIIVSMDNEKCAEQIEQVLKDDEKMKRISQKCMEKDYSNATEIEKIYIMCTY